MTTVSEFEDFVFAQRPTSSEHYDAEYFTGDWRDEGNNYSLETRRQIEARNPALIKEVFQPARVLDLGCGPGALMHLLWELGVESDGIDFSESSRRLATPTWLLGTTTVTGASGSPALACATASRRARAASRPYELQTTRDAMATEGTRPL